MIHPLFDHSSFVSIENDPVFAVVFRLTSLQSVVANICLGFSRVMHRARLRADSIPSIQLKFLVATTLPAKNGNKNRKRIRKATKIVGVTPRGTIICMQLVLSVQQRHHEGCSTSHKELPHCVVCGKESICNLFG